MKNNHPKKNTNIDSNVYLTGFMGSGKSSIGKILAKKVRLEFYDLDQVIETQTQMKIVEIFETKGESIFRKLESKYLKELSRKKNAVISLGGGTLLNAENLKVVKSTGKLIYLKASYLDLLKRLTENLRHQNKKNKRPLLIGQEKQQIKGLFRKRDIAYRKADIQINTKNKTKLEVANYIIKKKLLCDMGANL